MKLCVFLFFVFACTISDIQSAAASQDVQPAMMAQVRQREQDVLRDIDDTVNVIVDTLEALFDNNSTKAFFSSVLEELFTMTHYTDSLESLYLLNDAMNTVGDMVSDRETSDILMKAMAHLDIFFSNSTKHAQAKAIIDATHKIVMDGTVKEIKEGVLGFAEEMVRDPTKKFAIGQMVLYALKIGKSAKSVNMLTDSLKALDGIIMSPQLQSTILGQLKASAALLRMGMSA